MTDAAMIRVVLPAHLRAIAKLEGEARLDVAGVVTQRSVLTRSRLAFPCCADASATSRRTDVEPSYGSSPVSRTCLTSSLTTRYPRLSHEARSRSWSSAPWPADEDPGDIAPSLFEPFGTDR